ncbi:MAG: hypothetical protein HY847_02415 [Betaproteobacteria bacterium]|nr:hypothetical protein [Betaproteobacteria bacterium]
MKTLEQQFFDMAVDEVGIVGSFDHAEDIACAEAAALMRGAIGMSATTMESFVNAGLDFLEFFDESAAFRLGDLEFNLCEAGCKGRDDKVKHLNRVSDAIRQLVDNVKRVDIKKFTIFCASQIGAIVMMRNPLNLNCKSSKWSTPFCRASNQGYPFSVIEIVVEIYVQCAFFKSWIDHSRASGSGA